MDPVTAIAALWAAFAVLHLVLSGRMVRPVLVERLGELGFRGLYSVAVAVPFALLVWVFATHKHAGPWLWTTVGPPDVARAIVYVLMALALPLLVCSMLPGSTAPSAIGSAPAPAVARGILRITRHPLLAALAIWGGAHLLVNGTLGDVLFFGGFPLFVWIGSRHQDARLARVLPGYRELMAETSLVPFAAIMAGRQRLVARELPLVPIVVGLALAVVLRTYHGALFGP